MLKYACVSHVTGAIGFNLCIKNVSKTNLVSKVSLPLPWSSAPGAYMVNKSTTINQRQNPVISIG